MYNLSDYSLTQPRFQLQLNLAIYVQFVEL